MRLTPNLTKLKKQANGRMLKRLWPLVIVALVGCNSWREWRILSVMRPVDSAQEAPSTEMIQHRSAIPHHYGLRLRLDPNSKAFDGRIEIEITLPHSQDRISLDGQGLRIVSVFAETRDQRQPGEVESLETGRINIAFKQSLAPGRHTLVFEYRGSITSEGGGIYGWVDDDERYLFSHFEPNFAKTAFPCFDDRRFRTPYSVEIEVPKTYVAVSNSSETRRIDKGDWTLFQFAKTKPLPTYLVSFAVGQFDIVEASEPRAKTIPPLRILTTKGKGELAEYAMEQLSPTFDRLLRELKRPFPFDKLDLLVVPRFQPGASEGAGLSMLRESLILLDPDEATPLRMRWLQLIIARQLAHMWFGNQVTVEDAKAHWLHHAWAGLMANQITHAMTPNQPWNLDRVRAHHELMALESRERLRTLNGKALNPGQAPDHGDGLLFLKGTALLEMLAAWLTHEEFYQATRLYLDQHTFRTAQLEDWVNALDAHTDESLVSVFNSYTAQSGVPLVSFELECPLGSAPEMTMTQSPSIESDAVKPAIWTIPICMAFGTANERHRKCMLLNNRSKTFRLHGHRCPSWFSGNDDARGYYRWRADPERLVSLASQHRNVLTGEEHVMLTSMLTVLLQEKHLNLSQYLSALQKLVDEENPLVIKGVIEGLARLEPGMQSPQARVRYQRLIQTLFSPHLDRIGIHPEPGESDHDESLRELIVPFVGGAGRDPDVRSLAKNLASEFAADPQSIPARALVNILPLGTREGDLVLWRRLVGLLEQPLDPLQRHTLITALGAFEDPRLVTQSLHLVLDGVLPASDFQTLIRGMVPEAQDTSWMWMTRHYDALVARLGKTYQPYMPWLGSRFCTEADRSRVADFFGKPRRRPKGTSRQLKQVLSGIERCINQRNDLGFKMEAWLLNNGSATGDP